MVFQPCMREMGLPMRNVCILYCPLCNFTYMCSNVEYHWDTPEHYLSLPRTYHTVATCGRCWFCVSYDDAVENSPVLATGILLWLLRRRTQFTLEVNRLVGYPQWVCNSDIYCACLTSIVRLWLVFPTFIVLQLGKDIVISLNFAAEASSKLKKTKWKLFSSSCIVTTIFCYPKTSGTGRKERTLRIAK